MRILILGADGQLGRELTTTLGNSGHDVHPLTVGDCDITRPATITPHFDSIKPEAVINCAAWTRVDDAESDAEAAGRVNRDGARSVAEQADAHGALMCHISTDFIFSGDQRAPIDESELPGPRSVYGQTKWEGEQAVLMASRPLIIRTAWLYGQQGPNFVLTVLRRAAAGLPLAVVDDQRGTPTWTGHLAPAIAHLVEAEVTGVFHLTNAGEATWYEFARAILDDSGLGTDLTATTTVEYGAPAPRPAYSVLDNRMWRERGEPPLPAWREGLRAYLAWRRDAGVDTPVPKAADQTV